MTTTTFATDGLPGVSLAEWMETIEAVDKESRFAESVGVVITMPGGKMDATLLVSDSYSCGPFKRYSIAARLVEMYGEEARVIYPDIEKGVCET